MLQKLLAWLPAVVEDWPLPNRWMAHPPGGTRLECHGNIPNVDSRKKDPDTFRILSWNIHYGYGPVMHHGRGLTKQEVTNNLTSIASTIRTLQPDIVALQEVDRNALRSHDIDQLAWLAKETNLIFSAWTPTWDAGWVPYPGRNPRKHIGRVLSGQAVLSRFPIVNARRHALPQPNSRSTITNLFYLHRALLEVDLQLNPSRKLRIFNAHFEAFDSDNRDHHAHITARRLNRSGTDVVLVGDMNSVPEEAPQRHGFTDEPDTDMRNDQTIRILRNIPGIQEIAGFEIPADHMANWHTFPAHEPNRRLDYLFYGQGLKLMDGSVPPHTPIASDHCPVVATFSLKPVSAK